MHQNVGLLLSHFRKCETFTLTFYLLGFQTILWSARLLLFKSDIGYYSKNKCDRLWQDIDSIQHEYVHHIVQIHSKLILNMLPKVRKIKLNDVVIKRMVSNARFVDVIMLLSH